MQKKSTIAAIILITLVWTTFLPHVTLARVFDPHNIITDTDLFDADALSQRAIQTFLEREKSPLATYRQKVDGKNLRASEIIWKIAHEHSVNPKFLLTTLEKEQALISRGTATTKALDWATGFGCYGGTCREQYKGFYNQAEAAAITQESYRKNY